MLLTIHSDAYTAHPNEQLDVHCDLVDCLLRFLEALDSRRSHDGALQYSRGKFVEFSGSLLEEAFDPLLYLDTTVYGSHVACILESDFELHDLVGALYLDG